MADAAPIRRALALILILTLKVVIAAFQLLDLHRPQQEVGNVATLQLFTSFQASTSRRLVGFWFGDPQKDATKHYPRVVSQPFLVISQIMALSLIDKGH